MMNRLSTKPYRYTEARPTPVTITMLEDIDKNTVAFVPNFDDRLKEPTVLPGRLPNLLVNGSAGIPGGPPPKNPPPNPGRGVEAGGAPAGHPQAPAHETPQTAKNPPCPHLAAT